VRISGYTELRALDYRITGRTVLARHDATGDEVMIRYFTEEPHVDVEYRERVRRQVGQLSTVDSAYLVRVREVVEEDRVSAVVLESPRGVPLRALLAEQGVVTAEAALYLLRGCLHGLAAAHAAGVVHGGYRPEIVLVGVDGQVRLIDVGFARLRGDASARADIYAAVAAFVEFLTADATFTAAADLIAATPVTLRELVRAGLAEQVDAVALLAALDQAAVARYGAEWAERGRLWLAVRALELRVEELRTEAMRTEESPAAGVVAGSAAALLMIEEQRLRALRAQELRARAARADELRAAGLLAEAELAVTGLAATGLAATGPAVTVTGPAVTGRAAAGTPKAAAAPAGIAAPVHRVDVRRRRRSVRWLVLGGVVAVLVCGGIFTFWLSASQRPASAGGPGDTAPAAGGPSAGPSAASPTPSPAWSPAPRFSPVPNQGRG
jgi:Protein kinase domain